MTPQSKLVTMITHRRLKSDKEISKSTLEKLENTDMIMTAKYENTVFLKQLLYQVHNLAGC